MRNPGRFFPVALGVVLGATLAVAAGPESAATHPEWDAEYTRQIHEFTTGPQFVTDLVGHLPASSTVPTPLRANGYIAGAADHLTYARDVHAYMRALAAASPRVKVFSIGTTEEGREMIAVAVADEATIAALDDYTAITRALADPRGLTEAQARELIGRGKPIYYLTGGLHSPETGSPEMLMELAYRLAVEDTPLVRSIRENVITLITPVLEVDGRERMVDAVRWYQQHPDAGVLPLVYWGHYVAHDNNRDAVGLALALSRNVLATYLHWRPQVLHDLHESIPFLYVSSGTGPYNAWLDPLMVDEWERMANNEVQRLTEKGLPGVWTHGFYDGWAPNYLFWFAMGRNSLGRFYETFGNHVPSTEDRVVRGMSDRAWFRPNPPLPKVRWSLRDNVNYQESGALLALADTAAHRERVLELYFELGKRSVAKARTEGPAAYVFAGDQERRGQLRDLMALLLRQGIEVQVADRAFTVTAGWPPATGKPAPTGAAGSAASLPGADRAGRAKTPDQAATAEAKAGTSADTPLAFPAGSFIVRMDQPFSRLADALLDTQYVRGEERVYDDTGWTLGYARNLEWTRIVNPAVLDVPMHRWAGPAPRPPATLAGAALVVRNHADTDLVRLREQLPGVRMLVSEDAVEQRPAGTVLIPLDGVDREAVSRALAKLDLPVEVLARLPVAKTHALAMPRVALLHTWLSTQAEGWYRLALEELGVPYDYLSTQDVAHESDLRARYDVVIFPPADGASAQDIVEGLPAGPALPWRRSELTPNLGVDETDDMRPGLGLDGVRNLARFVDDGGLLITVEDTARWAITYGLARNVEVLEAEKLKAPGSLLETSVNDATSPIVYGYGERIPVYYAGGPLFEIGQEPRRERGETARASGRGSATDPDVPQGRPFVATPPRPTPAPGEEGFQLPENLPFFTLPYLARPQDRPRVVLAFAKEADGILLSGMLEGAGEIAGKAVVVDAPRGKGHVLLFACNPMWRATTAGSYALVMNAVLNFDHLSLGWPTAPAGAPGR
ncbi:MAG: M14 family zinc carboxypeptidase [Acidobacteriota bacterium]